MTLAVLTKTYLTSIQEKKKKLCAERGDVPLYHNVIQLKQVKKLESRNFYHLLLYSNTSMSSFLKFIRFRQRTWAVTCSGAWICTIAQGGPCRSKDSDPLCVTWFNATALQWPTKTTRSSICQRNASDRPCRYIPIVIIVIVITIITIQRMLASLGYSFIIILGHDNIIGLARFKVQLKALGFRALFSKKVDMPSARRSWETFTHSLTYSHTHVLTPH